MTSVRRHRDDAVVTLALAAPARRNPLGRATLAELRDGLSWAVLAGAAAVVITGDGGCFSAGADLEELTGGVEDLGFDQQLDQTVAAITAAPMPVLAAIEGPCVGAAVDLALGCDLRIASATAFFAVPAVELGLLYNPAALARIRTVLPAQTLARLFLMGERISGPDAVTAGIAGYCVEEGGALGHAARLAAAARGGEAMRATKAVLRGVGEEGEWEEIRLALLGSPYRRRAVATARERVRGRS